jgi:hypothetical protein
MEKSQSDMDKIVEYLNSGPKNLSSFDYRDWDDELTEKVMTVIRNTVPDGRLINEISSGVNKPSSTASSTSYSSQPQSAPKAPAKTNELDDFFNSSDVPQVSKEQKKSSSPVMDSSSSLDDLYADL